MAKMTATKLTDVMNSNGVYADKVFKSQGTFKVRRSFYYRHGQTASGWAAQVQEAVAAEQMHVVDNREVWADWPKESYWEATVVTHDEWVNEMQSIDSTDFGFSV